MELKVKALLRQIKEPQFMGKLVILLLLAGLALLFIEVRFEHQAVLGKRWQAWIPLFYCGLFMLTGPAGLLLWNRGGRIFLLTYFSLAPVIGAMGFWLHSKGDPWRAVCNVVKVVCMVPGKVALDVDGPPVLAPLALVGLGLLGLVICNANLGNGVDEQ